MGTPDPADDESEYGAHYEFGQRPVHHHHYTQSRSNGGSDNSKTNTILLGCLLAIVGFIGIQVWMMNGRMTAIEVTQNILLSRSGIATPPP